jgi:uncharacterized protein
LTFSDDALPVTLGRDPGWWGGGRAKTITFIVSEACQLRCRYCYVVGKNSASRMPFEIAQHTIEYVLGRPALFREPTVIWEFGIGEPFLDIELITEITETIKRRMFELQHP